MAREAAQDRALDGGGPGLAEPWTPGGTDVSAEVDPWAWTAHVEEPSGHADLSLCRVTAVLVALDAQRWLPETLSGLAKLRRRPDRVIAIDNSSSDSTRQLLEQARGDGVLDAVYQTEQTTGYGSAVQAALAWDQDFLLRAPRGSSATPSGSSRSGAAPQPTPSATQSSWLWLLHDDGVPAPDALEQLLVHVTSDPTIDITGPKLVLPRRRHRAVRLSEVGVSISGTGRREVLLDPDEIDQGQRDEPQSRLGVSTCGMLVRRSVWRSLDGLDPDVPVFRDGVDFGWRAHAAGYTVVTTPSAQFTHRQVGRAGLRPTGAAGDRPGRTDRYLGMLVVVGHAGLSRMPLVWLRLVWSCLVRSLGYLVGKAPGRSLDELLALGSFVAHPGRIRAVRRRSAAVPRAPGAKDVLHALRPPWWSSLRLAAETASSAVSERYARVTDEREVAALDGLTSDDPGVSAEQQRAGGPAPIVVAALLCAVAAVVASRSLLGVGSLTAPALLPAPAGLGDLWRTAWSPVVGAPGQTSPPWLVLMALGSALVGGRPEWFVTLLLCGVVPLGLLAAYPVVRRTVSGRRLRLWVALTYALLPVMLGGTNQGRLSLSVFAVGLPLLALAARALVLRRPREPEAWRGGWGTGIVLLGLAAFEPSVLVLAVGAGLIGAVALHRSPRKAGRIAIALGVPLVVLAPWWLSLVRSWGRLLTGPDAALGRAPRPAEVWQLLLGREVGSGLPPLWLGAVVFGVVWLVALVGLARRPRSPAVIACWLTALSALAVAALASRLVVSLPPVGAEARPWTGAYLLVGFGALVLAGGVGASGLSDDLARRSFSWLQPGVVLVGLTVGLVTALAAGWWVWGGASGPIQREALDALPPYLANALRSDSRARVLAVDLTGADARFTVLADDQHRLGGADRGYAFGGSAAATEQAADLVVRLVAGTADADIAPQLADLGVGYVWVAGADLEEQARIDNTPGLGTASGNDRAVVWQLEPAVSRTTLGVDDSRAPIVRTPTTIAPDRSGRLLRLGEPVDPRWRATLDGRQLTPVAAGWQQAFAVPTSGGTLDYALPTLTPWLGYGQGLLLVVAVVLAAPAIRRPEVRDPTRTARRAATEGGWAP